MICKKWQGKDIYLVADRYDGLHDTHDGFGNTVSLKEASRCRRRLCDLEKVYEIRNRMVLAHFSEIVQNSTSKRGLLVFLFDVWSHSFDAIPANTKIVMSDGFYKQA